MVEFYGNEICSLEGLRAICLARADGAPVGCYRLWKQGTRTLAQALLHSCASGVGNEVYSLEGLRAVFLAADTRESGKIKY